MILDAKVQAVIDELALRIKGDGERLRAGADRYATDMVQAAGPDTAGLLNVMIRSMKAKLVVEVGTSVGYTALYLGEAARATGGRVVGTEILQSKHGQACDYIRRAGLAEVVEIRHGDAGEIIPSFADASIDLAFLDAQKSDYCDHFDLLLPKMVIGGCIAGDNITYPDRVRELMQRYQDHVRANPRVRTHYVPVGTGLELTVRIS